MVHTFKCLGHTFVLDTESGSFFETDELTHKLIDQLNSPSKSNLAGEFSSYSKVEIDEAKAEINSLIKECVLFSSEPEHTVREFDGKVKSMCLNISHLCNLRCKYCFAGDGSYNTAEQNMSLQTAKNAIDFLIKKSDDRVNLEVDFFGGEPLLNMGVVIDTVKYARAKEKEFNKNFRFTITTNAYALTPEIMEFLDKEMYNVVLSIDGRESVHNTVRRTAGGKDSFEVALKNSLEFAKIRGDRQYYVRGTFTDKNKDFTKDALALHDYGFDMISLEPVVLPDGHELAIKEQDIPMLCKEYEVLAKEYLTRRANGKWFSFFHFNMDIYNGPCEHKRVASCGAGTEYIAVTPSGTMYPCHQFAGNSKYVVGDVNKNTYENIIPLNFWAHNNIRAKSECSKCWAKYFCSGGCAANAVNFNKAITKPHAISCALMKKRIECALGIYALESSAE